MRTFTAIVERDSDTGLYVGIIPGVPGAYTQGETLDELKKNLVEVLELCLEEMQNDGDSVIPAEFIGVQQVTVK